MPRSHSAHARRAPDRRRVRTDQSPAAVHVEGFKAPTAKTLADALDPEPARSPADPSASPSP